VPAQLPASEEVSTYPSRIRLAEVDWAEIVASNQEEERVYEQLRIGVYCFTMKHDMLACSGIAAVSNLQDPKACAPPQQPAFKPRHF
jgi:hypothetical protein